MGNLFFTPENVAIQCLTSLSVLADLIESRFFNNPFIISFTNVITIDILSRHKIRDYISALCTVIFIDNRNAHHFTQEKSDVLPLHSLGDQRS